MCCVGLTPDGYNQFGYTGAGYDARGCAASGPYVGVVSGQLWGMLGAQSRPFLSTLPRTCHGLGPLPEAWLQQQWISRYTPVHGTCRVRGVIWLEVRPSKPHCLNTVRTGLGSSRQNLPYNLKKKLIEKNKILVTNF